MDEKELSIVYGSIIDFLYEYVTPEKANLAHIEGGKNNVLNVQNMV